MDKIHEQFVNPDAFYKPAPFWIWNEQMESDEAIRQMEEFKKCGMGGGFAHVRNGLISEYLGDKFFEVFGDTLEAAKKLGLKLYMYDEYAWPSGMAGGLVIDAMPEARTTWMHYSIIPVTGEVRPDARVYAYDEKTKTVGKELTNVPKSEWQKCTDSLIQTYIRADGGEHPYVDISKPDVIKKFIEVTHEEYYKRFGKDFKDNLMAMFSDEASLVGYGDNFFIWSDVVLNKFYEMHGYKLEDNYLAIFDDFNGDFEKPTAKIRYDLSMTLHELWKTSFVKPIADWCEEHDIAWTGHDQEHSWPLTRGHAFSEQHTYEYRQWPGVDMLLSDALRDASAWNDTLLLNEVRSAANQFGSKRTICEAYGAAGWHLTFKDFKRMGDWIYVNGINFMIQHLTHYSIVGNRKTDCPQSIDWRQPWWGEYKDYNDYFARLSYILSQGKMEQRILIVNPTTTAYMIPAKDQKGIINHTFTPDIIKNPDMSDILKINQKLIDKQWDFDYGDEFSMEDNSKTEGKKFVLGAQKYDIVIVSKNMLNMKSSTVKLLCDFAKAGGTVLSTGKGVKFIDGEEKPAELEEMFKLFTFVDGEDGIAEAVEKLLPKRIVFNKEVPTGITHMRRVLDDGREVYFFVNHSFYPFEAKVTVPGDCVSKWDIFTGEKSGIKCRKCKGKITFDLKLEWNQSLLAVVGDENEIKPEKPQADKLTDMKLSSVRSEKDNILMLDHCKLSVDGKDYPELYFMQVGRILSAERHLPLRNLWDSSQFKTTYTDLNKNYGEGSGFKLTYEFTVKEGCVPERIHASVERPEFVTVSINGNVVEKLGAHWLDFRIGDFDITPFVKEGKNVITLTNNKFDTRFEVAGLVLEGKFGLDIENDRFVIGKEPENIGYGSWLNNKYYFYPNAMLYNYDVELDKKPESAKLVVADMITSCASVTVNGKYAGIIGKDGDDYSEIADFLKAGKNTVTIRVCGSFRNLYGPYINYCDQTVADGGQFRYYEDDHINRADEYQFIDYGIYQAPELYINK